MAKPRPAPCGSWKSPITSDLIVAESVGFMGIALDADDIYWVEMRPSEGGRHVVVHRAPDGETRDVTPSPFNARTRVHEYGGGAVAVADGVVTFSNFADQRLYRLEAGAADPRPLTPAADLRYADGVVDRRPAILTLRVRLGTQSGSETHSGALPQSLCMTISLRYIALAMGNDSVFEQLLGFASEAAGGIPDLRTGHTEYSMHDVGLAAFSVFFCQSASFLAHQRAMQAGRGFNNARTLFGIEKIPSDNWIRDLLDPVNPRTLYGAFDRCLDLMKEKGILQGLRTPLGHLLAGLDGTEFFRSEQIHCPHCSRTTHGKERIEYSHMVVSPAIMKPGSGEVFPLVSEFVRQEPGLEPQDCELVAGRRWISAHGARYRALGLTLLGDDKYANHPTCTEILQAGFHFILNCKPSSHKELYTSLEVDRKSGAVEELTRREWTGRKHLLYHYRYCNALPIRDSEDALQVNWMELIIACEESGKQEYHNSFITDFPISRENVEELVEEGRCRWKIENEHNNTLKTKGYHFEHNFGHGEDHLSEVLLLLNLLAFLFHAVLERLDEPYHRVRRKLSVRETFFDGVRELTRYLCFASWDSLLRFMLHALEQGPGPPPDPNAIIR